MNSAHQVASAFRLAALRATVLALVAGLTAPIQSAPPRRRQAPCGESLAGVIRFGAELRIKG